MTFKKILYWLIGLPVAYFGIGFLLVWLGILPYLPVAPDLTISYGGSHIPENTIEGPILRYQQGQLWQYAIHKTANGKLHPEVKHIAAQDTLTCNTQQNQFSFVLKPHPDSIQADQFIIRPNQKMFVVSDIEGNFPFFTRLLQAQKVIDAQLHWTFGDGQLILLGDYFDRGYEVTACLWLVYKLEAEANAQGGKVHFVLGNHDVANLCYVYNDVAGKYFVNADSLKLPYHKWYDEQSVLGQWLRTKPAILKINNYLFCHGGYNAAHLAYKRSIPQINAAVRTVLGKEVSFIKSTVNDTIRSITGINGILWYRGYFIAHDDYELAAQAEVDAVCTYYGVDKIIVGHTFVDHIGTRYNGRVIGIDVARDKPLGKNKPSALLIENQQFYAIDEQGLKFSIQ